MSIGIIISCFVSILVNKFTINMFFHVCILLLRKFAFRVSRQIPDIIMWIFRIKVHNSPSFPSVLYGPVLRDYLCLTILFFRRWYFTNSVSFVLFFPHTIGSRYFFLGWSWGEKFPSHQQCYLDPLLIFAFQR